MLMLRQPAANAAPLVALWIAIYSGVSLTSAAELPSEAQLPGESRPAEGTPPSELPPANAELPGESLLPGDVFSLPESQRPEPKLLPNESLLPATKTTKKPSPATNLEQFAQNEVPPEPAAEPEVGARPAGIPWLRFNVPGHSAPIRALTFVPGTQLLCSAGEDKAVQVWTPPPAAVNNANSEDWIHARTIRWQIQRGARGRVYALAASRSSLAVAGHGAMGMLGEIILVDPQTGRFQRSLTAEKGHRQVIASLSFSKSGNQLAALDVAGQASIWTRNPENGQWSFGELTPNDRNRYGAQEATKLAASRRTAPVIVAGEQFVVQPTFQEWKAFEGQPAPHAIWQLERIELATKKRTVMSSPTPHYGMVTALVVSDDNRLLASADAFGQLFLWDLGTGKVLHRQQLKAVAVSLAFDSTGKRLLAGTARSTLLDNKAQLQVFDLADPAKPRVVHKAAVPFDCYAAAALPGGDTLAYTQNTEIKLAKWQQPAKVSTINAAAIRPVYRVAFARERPFYRIAISTQRDANGASPLEMSFDPTMLQLGREAKLSDRDWLSGDTWKRNFELRPLSDRAYQVLEGDQVRGNFELRPEFHGTVTASCWIPDRTGKPVAVAVGTSSRGDIYVYPIGDNAAARPMRHFRGHGGEVTSLCVSRDLKYLVSGSTDATARIWPLSDFDEVNPLLNHWGVALEAAEAGVTISDIRPEGPLYYRGMRQGDTITGIAWHNGSEKTTLREPAKIIAALTTVDTDELVMFEYRRGRVAQEVFQIFPAYNPLAQLAISNQREWAYWTPAGYYDASFAGHKMFGWQINRGLDNAPEFFLAAQFRKALEKPEVMERLLEAGSLEAALKLAEEPPAVEGADALIGQIRSAPKIEILEPAEGVTIAGGTTPVKVSITVRRGVQLARVKVFANGVTAGPGELLESEELPGGTRHTYAFTARLPSESRVALDVLAATDAQTADYARVTVAQPASQQKQGKGRMFVFTAGINRYRDGQIPPLDFAVNNARKVAELLKQHSGSLYNAEAVTLTDSAVTPTLWRIVAQQYADSLRDQVSPDDLLVLFLSGHGLRDAATDEYYYVGADADYTQLQSRQFAGCISQADFALFSEIPCRKLVILDTCHSGAVHADVRNPELKHRDLKSAVRALQSDMMLTITASEGHEEAFEEKEREHGLFTSRLLEALQGSADAKSFGGDADGQVTLPETIDYVRSMVEADSADGGQVQHPTAGPADLLPLVTLPLTSTSSR